MKVIGNLRGKGKLGGTVYSITAGECITREYNPYVANPNTVSQMNQRSKLKLLSQLAAALAPVIAIPKDGLKSSRNLFISRNHEQVIANNGVAQIVYENIQLTNGNAGLPAIQATRSQEAGIVVKLAASADAAVSRVVYVVYSKSSENQLQYVGSAIQDEAGEDGKFTAEFDYLAGDIVIWAYGMKDLSASATAKYGDYEVTDGQDVAKLFMNRTLSNSDFQFTQTRGITLFSGTGETVNPEEGQKMVYINASGPGTVAGTGFTGNRKAVNVGDTVTVTATPNANCQFLGWQLSGGTGYVSTSAEYSFTVNDNTDLYAVFNDPNSGNGGPDDNGGWNNE